MEAILKFYESVYIVLNILGIWNLMLYLIESFVYIVKRKRGDTV